MKLFQKYILFRYFKNFFIIFFSLDFFYVSIDLLSNYQDLPQSANLQLLYIVFKALDALNYALPLAVVFAMIVSKFAMIRSNELVTLYAVGISKRALIRPLFFSAFGISVLYIGLNFTPFAYALEYSRNLLQYNTIGSKSEALFLKNNNQYVYFENLDPIRKKASGIKIFTIKDNDLTQIISADTGSFRDDVWILRDVSIKNKAIATTLGGAGFSQIEQKSYVSLKDFKPKIIENVYKGEYGMSILDAIDALTFFSAEKLNLDRIKTLLYSHTLFPLFAPLLLIILFYKLPLSSRFFNLAFLSFVFVFITLCVWGILFTMTKLSATSVIIPEIGVMLPILLLALYATNLYYKEN